MNKLLFIFLFWVFFGIPCVIVWTYTEDVSILMVVATIVCTQLSTFAIKNLLKGE